MWWKTNKKQSRQGGAGQSWVNVLLKKVSSSYGKSTAATVLVKYPANIKFASEVASGAKMHLFHAQ